MAAKYIQKIEEAKRTDLSSKRYLTAYEGAAHTTLGLTKFKAWAKEINCELKIGRRRLYDKDKIDAALQRGDAI